MTWWNALTAFFRRFTHKPPDRVAVLMAGDTRTLAGSTLTLIGGT